MVEDGKLMSPSDISVASPASLLQDFKLTHMFVRLAIAPRDPKYGERLRISSFP